jgi:class 3 adenylate cyclase/tetratricopeptide (TPR) repeat protein
MKCPKCQFENRESARFCLGCGAKLELPCPSCAKTLPLSARFCDGCGHDLTKPQPPPPIDYSQPLSYTPKHLADKILAVRPSIEGERKQVTVLFADVKGFTSISEKLDPEEVQTLISDCLGFFTEEIHRYEGAIAQFLGDGVMALFGAPIAHEDAPQRALYASLAIRECLRGYSAKLKKQGIDFNMRIGLNTGLVVVGRIGDDLTMEYTAMGDTVNLASRMESTAQPGTIQVSENTYRLTEGYFDFKPLGEKELKGKTELVKAYQLIGVGRARTRLGVSEMRGLTPFVGRRKELDHLMECYDKVKEGKGQVVGIVGEPGVGKSRLLLQLRSTLPQGEYSYLEGQCLHYGEAMAYLPIVNALRTYFDIEEGEQEVLSRKKLKQKMGQLDERLAGMLPPLQELLSLKVEDESYIRLDPQRRRERIFEAISGLFFRESQNKPLIMAVEDLHWIDKTSEEFLGYLIARLGGACIMLLLLYRPEYTNPWTSKTYYSQIRVDELPLETSAEMVQAILEEGKAAPELMNLILDRSAGNPLFMEEFTHSLLERGYIERKDGHYVLTVKPSDIQVPETVQGIIAARMDRLEKNLKETMQMASVIGREFPLPILKTVTGMQEKLGTYLSQLQALEFIYQKAVFPELEYIFKHALTQEVAYMSLLLKKRKQIHEKIAKAIEELYPDRLEEFYELLANHYSRSDNLVKAFQYLKLSGDKSSRNYSLWEAVRYYKEALNVLDKLPATEENTRAGIEVRLLMDFPEFGLGFPGDYLEILQEGERLSRELGDEKSLANFRWIMSCCYGSKGRYEESIRCAETAFKQAEEVQDIDVMIASGFELCQNNIWIGGALQIVEVAPRVIAVFKKTRRQADYFGRPFNTYSCFLGVYGLSMGYLGRFEEGEALCEKAVRFAREIDNRYSLAMTETYYSSVLTIKGDAQRALEHLQEAVRYGEATQCVHVLGGTYAALGMVYFMMGDLEAALKYLERGIQLHSDAGVRCMLSTFYTYLGMVHSLSGDLKSAQRYTEEALKLAQEGKNKWAEGFSRIFLGPILSTADASQSAKAEEHMLQGIRLLDELRLRPMCSMGYLFLGQHYAGTGRREEALQTLKKAEAAFQEMGMDYYTSMAQVALEALQAVT